MSRFYFHNNDHKISYATMRKLIRDHNGIFQTNGHFYHCYQSPYGKWNGEKDDALKLFGIDFEPTSQKLIMIDAYYKWADYGTRSIIPIVFPFIVDEFGIVKAYKLAGNGNMRDGWKPNPAKLELLWERQSLSSNIHSFKKERESREEAAKKAIESLPPIENGRYQVEGEIISTKWHITDFGMQLKMLVKLSDGNKVYGSVPAKITGSGELEGKRVKFTGTFFQKETGFGFFSRPTKAKVIE